MSTKKSYPAFNGLGRTPAVWGIPLMALLAVSVVSVFLALFCAVIWGPGGLLFAFLGVPLLFFFKSVCENDDQGLRLLAMELRCRLYWKRLQLTCFIRTGIRNPFYFGKSSTLGPLRYGRHLRVYKRFFSPKRFTSPDQV